MRFFFVVVTCHVLLLPPTAHHEITLNQHELFFFQNDITICHNVSGDLIQSKASGVHSMVRSAQLCPRKPGWCPSLKARNLSERTAPRFLGRYVMRSLGNLLTPNYSGWWFGPFYIFPWVNFITTSSGDRNQGR